MKTLIAVIAAVLFLAGQASAGEITVHSSKRYFQAASGKPVFLLGYYCWASVAPGYYIESPQRYADMITNGAPHKINYIRFSLGINALGGGGKHYWDARKTPTPFMYINGKADLDKWNPIFWDGLKYHAELAKRHGVMLHVCLFDGVDIRGGDRAHRWINSYWNIDNQVRDFYGDLDVITNDGNTDENGEFYRVRDFANNTGVGYYQRKIIDKALAVTAPYDNIFYEIGNEMMDSRADWNSLVIEYVKSKTKKAITQNGGRLAYNADGCAEHNPNTPDDVKKSLESLTGKGYPFWLDPDGSRLGRGTPDDLRRAVWYSFAGGAAGWGSFNTSFDRRGMLKTETAVYYGNLAEFIEESGVRFWEMVPHHGLVSNNKVNSCISKDAYEYVVYVLADPSVEVNLQDVTEKAICRIYDTKAGVWGAEQEVQGGRLRKFEKPAGADDWAIHIKAEPVRLGVR